MPIKRRSDTVDRENGRGRTRDEDDDRYAYRDDDGDDRSRRRRDDDDDERDERPRARRSRDRDDDDDDDRSDRRPRGRSRDDEDEDDRGSRRSRDRDDDRDEDRGRDRDRGRSSRRDEDEDDSRDRDRGRGSRGRDRDDDDDDRGGDRRKREATGVNQGWAGAHKTRDQAGSFAPSFQPEKDTTYVIRFLEDEPYASYRQHWIDRAGKKSYVCPEDPDDAKSPRCPLCDNGAEIRAQYAFNIVLFEEKQKPRVISWDMGVRLMQKLERINKDDKIGPLSKPYFAVTRTGKGTASDTQLSPIKARDLWDDYGVEELTDDEFDRFYRKRFDASIVNVPGMQTLRDIAKEMTKFDG